MAKAKPAGYQLKCDIIVDVGDVEARPPKYSGGMRVDKVQRQKPAGKLKEKLEAVGVTAALYPHPFDEPGLRYATVRGSIDQLIEFCKKVLGVEEMAAMVTNANGFQPVAVRKYED